MEQSIFTYCYKRFDEQGGGWGFYSYSPGMKEYFAQIARIKTLAGSNGYEIPKNREVWLVTPITDYEKDIAQEAVSIRKYHPEKFSYTYGDHIAVLTYGRNLGREIVNENRTANKLVYTLAGEKSELLDYPCFYFGNPDFQRMTRSFFKDGGRESPEQALSPVAPEKSAVVTRRNVQAFLSGDAEREDVLVKLFYTLIHEKSGQGRPILICDRKENIIYWIAAVTLLFPLEIAKEISFTTYDFLGSSIGKLEIPDDYCLCGVYSPTANGAEESEATNYDVGKLQGNDGIVIFDVEFCLYPDAKTDAFETVIRAFCRCDDSELIKYHKYIIENTKYRNFDATYTMFYPLDRKDEMLFPYYSSEVQTELFHESYPFLFDISADADRIKRVVYVTECAFNAHIVTKDSLSCDAERFTTDVIQKREYRFSRLEQISPVLSLLGLEPKRLVKMVLKQNRAKWTDYFTNQDVIPAEKLDVFLSVLDPFDREDIRLIQIFSGKSPQSPDGRSIVLDHVAGWFADAFMFPLPMTDPDALVTLAGLCDGDAGMLQQIAGQFFNWEMAYRQKVLVAFENSALADKFFRHLEAAVWTSRKDSFGDALSMIDLLDKMENGRYEIFYEHFAEQLCKADANSQKRMLEKLLMSPTHSFHPDFDGMIGHIYEEYDFQSPEELARFSYALFNKLMGEQRGQYPFDLVCQAYKRAHISKRAWKKGVEAITPLSFQKRSDAEIKRLLSENILEMENTGRSNNETDSGGLLKKIFGKKKK